MLNLVCMHEEEGLSTDHFHAGSNDARPEKIEEEKKPRGPYDCISNPAPWWHQITVHTLRLPR